MEWLANSKSRRGDEGDRVRTVLDQRAKALLALATGLFRAGLLGPRAPQIEGPHTAGPPARGGA